MSNDFNEMLSQDLAEVSAPIMRLLVESGNYNLRGLGALLQLASCMAAENVNGMPSDTDHKLAETAFKDIAANPLAMVSFIAQLAKACVMVHHGYGRKNG